ncbi:uncharacterized protein N7506_005716 [Penicillium brevicompactum]|uniref:uncharacterized protein n=1 Tax=Penicillium brevicompactum TaxID=5074 RepID=UPI00253F918A|nr:uncharacterized protein N7506_005716 [Penicillium brevicompactum]KAJ5335780.1 hypothetical protein N7506_005716 [Penicillium brevicompactum]
MRDCLKLIKYHQIDQKQETSSLHASESAMASPAHDPPFVSSYSPTKPEGLETEFLQLRMRCKVHTSGT